MDYLECFISLQELVSVPMFLSNMSNEPFNRRKIITIRSIISNNYGYYIVNIVYNITLYTSQNSSQRSF